MKVGVVASKDITFKIVDLEKLMNEALNTVITVTQNNRKRCVRHSEKLYLLGMNDAFFSIKYHKLHE